MSAARVVQAYRFALEPTPAQERALRSHAGAARFARNWGLAKCRERYAAEGRWYSATDLHRAWNAAKKADPGLAWWSENCKCVYQEAFPTHSRKKPGSANRRKAATRLARVHAHMASTRADAVHKVTTDLARRYAVIVAEGLNVAGMIRNRRLARAISDQGFGTVLRMLGYKTAWSGGRLITADRWFPSSKMCSGCGAMKAKLALSERTFTCRACGIVIDRDKNAARNLLNLAASGAESLNACGGTVRPGLAGHAPVKQEPGTAPAGQTGTASGQPRAAGLEPTHAH